MEYCTVLLGESLRFCALNVRRTKGHEIHECLSICSNEYIRHENCPIIDKRTFHFLCFVFCGIQCRSQQPPPPKTRTSVLVESNCAIRMTDVVTYLLKSLRSSASSPSVNGLRVEWHSPNNTTIR